MAALLGDSLLGAHKPVVAAAAAVVVVVVAAAVLAALLRGTMGRLEERTSRTCSRRRRLLRWPRRRRRRRRRRLRRPRRLRGLAAAPAPSGRPLASGTWEAVGAAPRRPRDQTAAQTWTGPRRSRDKQDASLPLTLLLLSCFLSCWLKSAAVLLSSLRLLSILRGWRRELAESPPLSHEKSFTALYIFCLVLR